jgi:hypothetical protein
MTGTSFSASIVADYGYNTIEILATDLAGNTSTEKRTVVFDNLKPSLAIIQPAQDMRTNVPTLVLKGTVADALTAVTVSVEMDGQTYAPPVVNGEFQQSLSLAEEKTYSITVTATDEVGTAATAQRNVIYDITPPPVAIDPVASPTDRSEHVIAGNVENGATVTVSCASATVGQVSYPTASPGPCPSPASLPAPIPWSSPLSMLPETVPLPGWT